MSRTSVKKISRGVWRSQLFKAPAKNLFNHFKRTTLNLDKPINRDPHGSQTTFAVPNATTHILVPNTNQQQNPQEFHLRPLRYPYYASESLCGAVVAPPHISLPKLMENGRRKLDGREIRFRRFTRNIWEILWGSHTISFIIHVNDVSHVDKIFPLSPSRWISGATLSKGNSKSKVRVLRFHPHETKTKSDILPILDRTSLSEARWYDPPSNSSSKRKRGMMRLAFWHTFLGKNFQNQ